MPSGEVHRYLSVCVFVSQTLLLCEWGFVSSDLGTWLGSRMWTEGHKGTKRSFLDLHLTPESVTVLIYWTVDSLSKHLIGGTQGKYLLGYKKCLRNICRAKPTCLVELLTS
jgi:hypothetical protein